MFSFDRLVLDLCETASDIYLRTNRKPLYKEKGIIKEYNVNYTADDERLLLESFFKNEYIKAYFLENGDADISWSCKKSDIESVNLRLNIFKDLNGMSIAVRIFPSDIMRPAEAKIPSGLVDKIMTCDHGIVLVCGPTGSGKTTTISSIIDYINTNETRRIICIEDPIEYRYKEKKSVISQREIGSHCKSFEHGLKAALRQDPDIIMIGELRDCETVRTALMAAETGHLVFSTLHTSNTAEAVDRIVQYFPADEQDFARNELAGSFNAIVTQKLLKTQQGLYPVFELCYNTPAICNLIRKGSSNMLQSYMNIDGMITMERAINKLSYLGIG